MKQATKTNKLKQVQGRWFSYLTKFWMFLISTKHKSKELWKVY